MAHYTIYQQCEKCQKYFPEDEMDIVKGLWICNSCEQELWEDDGDFYHRQQ